MKANEITGLQVPEVLKAMETIQKRFPASRIEIQLKGSQYIKVHFDEVTTITENGEVTIKPRSYTLKNATPIEDENGDVTNMEEMHLHEWNASPVGQAILQAIENHLTVIIE